MRQLCSGGVIDPMEKTIYSREYAIFLRCFVAERKRAGLTQAQLAERIGETQSFVSKCERGERRIDIIELRSFCKAIGVTPGEFLNRLDSTLEFDSS